MANLLFYTRLVLSLLYYVIQFIVDVMDLRKGNTNTILTKSVKGTPAQNAILCGVLEAVNPVVSKALYLSSGVSSWPVPMRVIIDIQLREGLRVSEVLRIRHNDILSLGRLKVTASKKGQDRVINYDDPYGYLKFCKTNGVTPFKDYDRFFLYRAYKKEGIVLFHDLDKKSSVTHALRHLLVQQLTKEIEDKSLISTVLGHKSTKTISWYDGTKR